jgi:hypothetical protein
MPCPWIPRHLQRPAKSCEAANCPGKVPPGMLWQPPSAYLLGNLVFFHMKGCFWWLGKTTSASAEGALEELNTHGTLGIYLTGRQ